VQHIDENFSKLFFRKNMPYFYILRQTREYTVETNFSEAFMYDLISFLMNNFLYLFLKVSYTQSFPPPLSPGEEEEYFRRMQAGDRKAREKLIEHNLRLVAHIVKKYYTASDSQEDLISIGTIGLIKAIDSFNPKNGARFATYAGKCLQNAILS
jgi:RNA polymerase sporulation-specific sigma factor